MLQLQASGDVSLLGGCNDYACAMSSVGGLAGSAEVEELQRSLLALSQAAGWPAANPGSITGSVNQQTVIAIGSVIAQLSDLDSTTKLLLQGAIAAATKNSDALQYASTMVAQYAKYLTAGVKALTLKYAKTSGSQPTGPGSPTGPGGIKIVKTIDPALLVDIAGKGKYPAGTLTAFSPKIAAWRVAVPAGSPLGAAVSLGAAYTELAPVKDQPPGAQVVTEKDIDAKTGALPFYKDWRYMVPIGGVLVLGTVATIFVVRRRR